MEKLSLEEFRKYKKELNKILQEENNEEYDEDVIVERYKKVIERLSEYDLSDIDFNEWKDIRLVSDDRLKFDFSKTNANLDFSIIDVEEIYGNFNFKGCKIKNFALSNIGEHYPEMFDEDFIKENEDYFLTENIPKDVQERYYGRRLTFNDVRDNVEIRQKYHDGFAIREFDKIFKKIDRENLIKFNVKDWVKNHKEYNLSKSYISNLIELSEDVEFIEDCIKNHDEYDLNFREIIELTKLTKDVKFIEECIRHHEEYNFSKYLIKELIELKLKLTGDVEFVEDFIRHHEEYNFDIDQIYKFIELKFKLTKDVKFIEDCIINHKEYNFNNYFIQKFIELKLKLTGDVEFVEDCIRHHEEYNFNIDQIIELTKLTKDVEFIGDCISNYKKYNFDIMKFIELKLELTGDVEFIKDCIRNHKDKFSEVPIDNFIKLINLTENVEFIEECLINYSKYGFDKGLVYDFIRLRIELPRNTEFIEKFVRNRKEYEFDERYILHLINLKLEKSDYSYIKNVINNSEKIFNVKSEELVKNLSDLVMEKICSEELFDKEKLEEILQIKDADYIKNSILKSLIKIVTDNSKKNNDDFNKELSFIYETFLTNNLPTLFKEFEFFKYHNNYNATNREFYYDKTKEERDLIIRNDLFQVALGSNNYELRCFLEDLQNGDKAYKKYKNGEKLNELDEAIILNYRNLLSDFSNIMSENKMIRTSDVYRDIDYIDKINNFEEKDLGESLLKKYLDKIGIQYNNDSNGLISNLLEYMDIKVELARKRSTEEFKLEEGDLIKGTSLMFIPDMLENGIRSKEFYIEGSLYSDATPLDTDFSEITKQNLEKESLHVCIGSTYTGFGFGKSWIVLKNYSYDQNDDNNYSLGNTRYIRTAKESTAISKIITSEWDKEYMYELAKRPYYIEVIDLDTEKTLFTRENYEEIRKTMQGISRYSKENYQLSSYVENNYIKNEAQKLRDSAKNKTSTKEKYEKIMELMRENIDETIITEMSGDITKRNIELIDTGSTGRGTNIPGEGDFDFMLKCANPQEQVRLIEKIKKILQGVDKGGTDNLKIRYTDVKLDGIEEPVEIDITSEKKSLQNVYSTDMCIKDKLENIKRIYGIEKYEEVVDNILVAKKILKENGIYKKSTSIGATQYGGFGGVGVETWILQNGGSLVEAMKTFLDKIEKIDETVEIECKDLNDEEKKRIRFDKFKEEYPIYDFGQNHRENLNAHDHFINGLTIEGFEKMQEVFKEYLREYEIDDDSIKEIFSKNIKGTVSNDNDYLNSDYSRASKLIARLYAYKTYERQECGAR